VPADLEMEATARTLEYAYDDWCMAQFSTSLGKINDYSYFLKRSGDYKNVFDTDAGFVNGRFANGNFRENLNPYYSNHRRDDFCEGNAWQWSFFVPHDVKGLAELRGGVNAFEEKLDHLFSESSKIEGDEISHDITGLIGQYAHGNEPSHHIAYMYNEIGKPAKTQNIVHPILTTLYDDTPDGLCENEDTGQLSAWCVFSSIGIYPANHGLGDYYLGAPLFDEVRFKHANGILKISSENVSDQNKFVKTLKINGKNHSETCIKHTDIFRDKSIMKFEMNKTQN